MQNLRGETFSPHAKFVIVWIPIPISNVRHYQHLYLRSAVVRLYPGQTEVGWGGQCCRFPWRSLGTPFRSMACVYWLRKNNHKSKGQAWEPQEQSVIQKKTAIFSFDKAIYNTALWRWVSRGSKTNTSSASRRNLQQIKKLCSNTLAADGAMVRPAVRMHNTSTLSYKHTHMGIDRKCVMDIHNTTQTHTHTQHATPRCFAE